MRMINVLHCTTYSIVKNSLQPPSLYTPPRGDPDIIHSQGQSALPSPLSPGSEHQQEVSVNFLECHLCSHPGELVRRVFNYRDFSWLATVRPGENSQNTAGSD